MRGSRRSVRKAAKLKGIRRVRQDGKVYRYHRATGTRLPDDMAEDDPKFLAAYLAAETATAPKARRGAAPRSGTLAHAWWQFVKSDDFLDLSESYRGLIRAHGEKIIETGGKVPINQVRPYHIEHDINGLNRSAARMRLKTWRKLLKWAKPKLVEKNWAMQVEMPKAKKGDGHKRWSDDNIETFRTHWPIGTAPRLAFELMLFTGMRICDAVRCGPGWIDKEGWMAFAQKKTKGDVLIAFDRALPEFADGDALSHLQNCLRARNVRHMTWLATIHGKSRSDKAASNWFSQACRDAGLKNELRRTAHGLRDTCCARMAERGATAHQIMTWSGHESLSEVERYTKDAQKKAVLTPNDPGTKNVQASKS